MLRRLRSKPEVIKRYDDVIHEQLHTGKIKPVSMEEQPEVRKVRHLPYRELPDLKKTLQSFVQSMMHLIKNVD